MEPPQALELFLVKKSKGENGNCRQFILINRQLATVTRLATLLRSTLSAEGLNIL